MSFDLTSLSYAFGFGRLSAGHYDAGKNGWKYFGMIGHNIDQTYTQTGFFDNWNYSNTTGLLHSAFTFVAVVDQAAGEYY